MTWCLNQDTSFHHLAIVLVEEIIGMRGRLDPLGGCSSTRLLDIQPILNDRDGAYTTKFKFDEIEKIMRIYSNDCEYEINPDYKFGHMGCSLALFDFMVKELIENEDKPDHPFVDTVLMASYQTTLCQCPECNGLLRPYTSSHTGEGFTILSLVPSESHGRDIITMLDNFTEGKPLTSVNSFSDLECQHCKSRIDPITCTSLFLPFTSDCKRVLIINVGSAEAYTMWSGGGETVLQYNAVDIPMSFDFTKYVDDQCGFRYQADLIGYLSVPTNNRRHYIAYTRGGKGNDFFESDDPSGEMLSFNVGADPIHCGHYLFGSGFFGFWVLGNSHNTT
jgi:hypothetical protein